MTEFAKAMRHVAMAIAASRRLGWIALGIYIMRMNVSAGKDMPFYKTILEYHQAMNNSYHAIETSMAWADDYRMVMFNELVQRLDAIEDTWDPHWIKEQKKSLVMKKAQRARLELTDAWL